MRTLITALIAFSASTSAFAISNEDLAARCLAVGKAKVVAQAEAYGCKVDADQVTVQKIDNRWYNPSKYVWYQAMGDCNGADRVIQLVQYYGRRCI